MLTLDDAGGRFAYNEAFRQSVRQILQREGMPHVDWWERDRLVPGEFWRRAGEVGMLCPTVPEQYGGRGWRWNMDDIPKRVPQRKRLVLARHASLLRLWQG
jgi:hypothetical protein